MFTRIIFSSILAVLAFSATSHAAIPNLPKEVLTVRQQAFRSIAIKVNFEAGNFKQYDLKYAEILRSTSPSFLQNPDGVLYPVTKTWAPVSLLNQPRVDDYVADDVTYYYSFRGVLKSGQVLLSQPVQITTRNRELDLDSTPTLLINKEKHILEVIEDGMTVKTYGVTFGKDPKTRKLHADKKTTPEGIYKITFMRTPNTSPPTQFYRGLDINYPNNVDKYRYDLMRSNRGLPEIGGDILIHGASAEKFLPVMHTNSSDGCIALENKDIEELFGQLKKVGGEVTVAIGGGDILMDDIELMLEKKSPEEIREIQLKLRVVGLYDDLFDGVFGEKTERALCDLQARHKLPITCALDFETREVLKTINIGDLLVP